MSDPDPELVEAVEEIPEADPDSITQYDDGHGMFVINQDIDGFGGREEAIEAIDGPLEDAGYEDTGVIQAPGMLQQNFAPIEEDEHEDS